MDGHTKAPGSTRKERSAAPSKGRVDDLAAVARVPASRLGTRARAHNQWIRARVGEAGGDEDECEELRKRVRLPLQDGVVWRQCESRWARHAWQGRMASGARAEPHYTVCDRAAGGHGGDIKNRCCREQALEGASQRNASERLRRHLGRLVSPRPRHPPAAAGLRATTWRYPAVSIPALIRLRWLPAIRLHCTWQRSRSLRLTPARATAASLRHPERPANVSSLAAGVLEESVTQSPLGEWLQSSDADIHARLALFSTLSDGRGPSSAANPPCSHSRSVRSTGSSMAPAWVHQSNASTQAPSLSNFSEATPTETSVSTGQASFFTGGVPLLEDDNGVLVRPQHACRAPVYECAFWFLRCSYISYNMEEWHTHCLSHFHGEEPPRSVRCPLCEWEHLGNDGKIAWDRRMDHIAYEHFQRGQTWKTSRPDFGLFHHLWNKRLIDDQDLKELKGGNHNLARAPLNFTVTGTGRRDRDGRRQPQRTQHVGVMRHRVAPVRT